MKAILALCTISLLVTGCTLFDRQERRINYTERLDEGRPSLITDAKQRVIINAEADVGRGDATYSIEEVNGKAVVKRDWSTDDSVVKNHPNRIICAEPSPDVAQAISAAFTAAAEVEIKKKQQSGDEEQARGAGNFGSSYAASVAQLGERLATVQLLRDKMYRACEAYQNGAISDTSYTLMLSRFDKTMSSMLAAEVAAGAFGRNLAALGGSAGTGGADPKKLAEARDAVKAAAKALQDAAALPETDEAAKTKKKAAIADANTKLNDAVANLAELEFQAAATVAQSGPVYGGANGAFGQIVGRSAIDADAVALINTNYLDDDATGTLIDACVVALDRNRSGPSEETIARRNALASRQVAIAEAMKKNRIPNPSPPDITLEGVINPPDAAVTAEVGNIPPSQLATEAESVATELAQLDAVVKKPSLGSVCAAILGTNSPSTGLLATLQQKKFDLRNIAVTALTKQYELSLAKTNNCRDMARTVPETTRMDSYMACLKAQP